MYNISSTCQIPSLSSIYNIYFPENYIGYFIEVGAYDGESFSNTSCLADNGWSGIYIEPVYNNYIACKERHKNNKVIVENLSIGSKEGEITIYCDRFLSTTDKNKASLFSEEIFKGSQFSESSCNQLRLDTLMKKYETPINLDLLVIDVEGSEFDVLKSFNINYWKPKMLIIELIDNHKDFAKFESLVKESQDIREYILNSNYIEIYKDNINTIFIKK